VLGTSTLKYVAVPKSNNKGRLGVPVATNKARVKMQISMENMAALLLAELKMR